MADRTVGVRTTRVGIHSTSAQVAIEATSGTTLGSGTATTDTTYTANIGDRNEFVARFISSSYKFVQWAPSENLDIISTSGTSATYRFKDELGENNRAELYLVLA